METSFILRCQEMGRQKGFHLQGKRRAMTDKEKKGKETMEYKLEVIEVKGDKEILTPADAVEFLAEFRTLPREVIVVVHLTPNLMVQSYQKAAIGNSTTCAFETSDIFRESIVREAKAILIAHNHPWQKTVIPTHEDIEITQDLFDVGKKARMPLVDHIVLGKGDYYSFKEKGKVFEKGKSYTVQSNPHTLSKAGRRAALRMLALISTGLVLK